MNERIKLVAKIVGICIFMVIFLFGYYNLKRMTQVYPTGGKNEDTAVKIHHQTEEISIKVFLEKQDRMYGMYAYWDDNKEKKQKLKKGLFTAKAKVEVPKTHGIHKLTIEVGFPKIKYNYYYEIEKRTSE